MYTTNSTRCCEIHGEENGADLDAGLLLAGCNRKIMAKRNLKCFSEDINNLLEKYAESFF
jgi:hypothetical protein